jgi:tetratricopeptide (TPR) repeat protein
LDINPLYIICPLAIIGLVLTRRNYKKIGVINLLLLSQFFLTLVFFLNNRHRVTIVPFLLMYESVVFWWLVDQVHARNFIALTRLCGVGVFLVFYFTLCAPKELDSATIDFLTHIKYAPLYEKQEEFARARMHYGKALSIFPQDATTVYNLANTYFGEKNYGKAIQYYNRALDLAPHHVDAVYNLAYTYMEMNNTYKAMTLFKKVLHHQPNSIDAHFHLAQIYTKRRRCQDAIRHYQIILKQEPHLSEKILPLMKKCRAQKQRHKNRDVDK